VEVVSKSEENVSASEAKEMWQHPVRGRMRQYQVRRGRGIIRE
jgi:hypothetical protein